MEIYVVQPDDSVEKIAGIFGADPEAVIYANQLSEPYLLAEGQALLIPGAASPWRERRPLAHVLGYAYPFISPWVLAESLPYLSALLIFSYGFTEDGELVEPALDDQWMIRACGEQGTRPVLTFTSIGPDGRFQSSLVEQLLKRPSLQEKVLWELGRMMREKGFQGLDFDFEYIPAQEGLHYADFVGLARRVMNLFGYPVSVALAPKTSGKQKGLLYEGMDYGLLGQAANQCFLMTYEWGYTYGPPMAVAPLHMVRRVAEYALTEIPANQLILGIPNYGYDWPLPYERGTTKAKTLGNVEAARLAALKGAVIRFDERAQSPYFHYKQDGVRHEVWFEDVRSYEAKFRLVQELGLKGFGFWQMMQLFRAGLLLAEDMFRILKP